jgi:predicted RNA-binding protein with PIN domain
MILIDGYNLIHASGELQRLASEDLESAREQLVRLLIEYSARQGREIEVVFDGKGSSGAGASSTRHTDLLTVTFTARGMTADSYIEAAACRKSPKHQPATVVTGDYQQQKIVSGAGVLRMSSREFLDEMRESKSEVAADGKAPPRKRMRLERRLPDETTEALRRLRDKLGG